MNGPSAAEIEAVGRLLLKYRRASAQKALAPFLHGDSPWDQALRRVKELLKDAITDLERGHKIPIAARNQLNNFAAKYGTTTRTVIGAEPLDIRKTLRFGESEWAMYERAAKERNMTPTEFIRYAAAKTALEALGEE